MEDQLRRRAEELFQRVVDLPRIERPAFLDREADSAVLRAEVESLLAHFDDGTVTFLQGENPDAPPDDNLVGGEVGAYKLLQVIGEGGFGSVYMAEQREPVRRLVALKVIKLGMDTKQVIARFDAERQALAMMDHPNIAKVLDAGATDTGRPYFVMELVRGVPVTEYCDEHNLSMPARLKLFVEVCRAVQHAHHKGIIHRDLKPSNVLVTLHDGKPVPKVIDFGIAKATNQRLTEMTLFTEFRQFIGTPAYMSPEQAEMSGLDVDTRSDLYSLGVLLYELLTGTTPFDSRVLRSLAYGELQRIIREEEPPKPSIRISTLGASLGQTARLRQVEPAALRRLIRGDLDWIVMKALEKDRTRRYQTAAGLAADVERHLRNEPVHAGPPSARYKLLKFMQRHRVGVTAGLIVAAALVSGLALATTGFIHASRQRDAADRAADRARSLSNFLQDMLATADPMQTRLLSAFVPDQPTSFLPHTELARDISLTQMVRQAAKRIDEAFAGKPALEADAREMIGMTLRGMGLYGDAEPQLRTAYELRASLLGPEHPETLRAALALGALLVDAGRSHDAEPLVRLAADGLWKLHGAEDPRTLSAAAIMALVYSEQGDYTTAASIYARTLEAQRHVLGHAHRDTLFTLFNWSVSCLSAWRLEEGRALARQLYELADQTLSEDDSLRILSRPLMGWWHLAQYEYDRAEALLRPGLAQCRRILGDEHPFTYMTMHGLARSLQGRDVQHEKESLHRQALAGLRATRGRDHWHTILTTDEVAKWLDLRGSFEEAERLYREQVADGTRLFGRDHDFSLKAMSRLADYLERVGKVDEAVAVRREMLQIQQARGTGTLEAMNGAHELARTLVRLGRLDEARAVMRALLDETRQRAERFPEAPLALNNHAWFLVIAEPADLRDPPTALPLAQRAVELSDGRLPAVLDTLAHAYHLMGDNERAVEIQTRSLALLPTDQAVDLNYGAKLVRYLLHKGDRDAAEEYVEKSVTMYRAALGENNPLLAVRFNESGVYLTEAGDYSLAEALIREALRLNRALLGPHHEQVALSLHNLAQVLLPQNRYAEAAGAFRDALAMRQELLGDDHLLVAETRHALGRALQAGGDSQAAAAMLQQTLDTYHRLGADALPAALEAERDLAGALLSLGRVPEAAPLARVALERLRAIYRDNHYSTIGARRIVALVSIAEGRPAEAEPLLRESLARCVELNPAAHDRWRQACLECALGQCLTALARYNESETLLLTGYQTLQSTRGDTFLETRTALENLITLYDAWDKPLQASEWRDRLAKTPTLPVSPIQSAAGA